MKKIISAILLTLVYCFTTSSQTDNYDIFEKNGEVCFSFELNNPEELNWLTKIISVDYVEGNNIRAYANKEEFASFLKTGLKYTLLPHPNEDFDPKMANWDELKATAAWDAYPTYTAYVAMMYQFQANYPAICTVFSIGQSVQGRELLVAKISDNVQVDEAEPEFFYTSSMHGDELTGYVLMLRLIDSLLTTYGTSPRITNLVNNIEIFINPLANPDGAYKTGNNSVSGAVRNNANNLDLNRNFPDIITGPHPNTQPETYAFMAFAESRSFVSSCNIHGGAEVCNYPWDRKYALAADDNWWQYVCHEYADTAQTYSPSSYMSGFNDGITNGAAWYVIDGGRQDYMNFFHQCREFTLEISNTKLPSASSLPAFWGYNRRSFLNYMEQCTFGIRGMITNANTGQPVEAEVYVLNHEIAGDSSWVYASPAGNYHRLLNAGTYNVRFSAPCYETQIFNNISVVNKVATNLNVQLVPQANAVDFSANKLQATPGENIQFTDLSCNALSWFWTFSGPETPTFVNGTNNTSQNPVLQFMETGSYTVSLTIQTGVGNITETKVDYILITAEYLMSNSTVTTCYGLFYDSGGQNGNYTNNQDFTMTFYPGAINGKINLAFTSFNLEYHSTCNYDWLKVFNGPNTASPLIGTYCGTNSPGNVTSTHSTGALTFQFHSDVSVVAAGWAASISCILTPIETSLKVFLQGPFIGTQMNNPLISLPDFPVQQPYAISPWNYEGNESVATIPNPNVVDWILAEIRDANTAATADAGTRIARKAGFLLSNGNVVSSDGVSNLIFHVPLTKGLFPVIHHRNHLSIISSSAVSPVGGIYSYDFSVSETTVYNGASGYSQLTSNIWGMTAGDGDADGQVNENDLNQVWSAEAGESGYLPGDLNLDGEIENRDKIDGWLPAVGKGTQVP